MVTDKESKCLMAYAVQPISGPSRSGYIGGDLLADIFPSDCWSDLCDDWYGLAWSLAYDGTVVDG